MCFLQKCWPETIAPKIFSLFQTFLSFFKQIKKIGVEGSNPIFFICFYFIRVGGDENLKSYLAWPKAQY